MSFDYAQDERAHLCKQLTTSGTLELFLMLVEYLKLGHI